MIQDDFAASIFPNPNSGNEVFVALEGLPEKSSSVSIEILDLYGRTLTRELLTHKGSEFGRWIQFQENLPMGMYMIRIALNEESNSVHRMVVK